MNYDLKITWPKSKRSLTLQMTNRKLEARGQHGQATILLDDTGESWLLKKFANIIDTENKEIFLLDVDLESSADDMKNRLHLWRVLNEKCASNIASKLGLNVPEVILITSARISDIKLNPETELGLDEDIIILDDESDGKESAEEVYGLSQREDYIIETSEAFENLLGSFNDDNDPCLVIGALIKYIPNSMNLDMYLESRDFDEARKSISNLDNGFKLLPFDVWLNDPDRNQGNYLITMDSNNNPVDVYGLDYEMFSFADDIWMDLDELTMGRSYLTAIIHHRCTVLDPRIMETLFKISSISNNELASLTIAPKIICQFIEYHIGNSSLMTDERIKLLNIEQNLWDFLYETRPKFDKLTIRIIRQIGLPEELKELENNILAGIDDEVDESEE